jgi:flagellar motility protein MotE (MotC chaperone)
MSSLLPPSKLLPATIIATAVALGFKTTALVTMAPSLNALWAGTSQALDVASTASVISLAQAASPQPAAASIPQVSSPEVPQAAAPTVRVAPVPPPPQSAPPTPAAAPPVAVTPASPPPAEAQSAPLAPAAAASDATQEVNLRRSQIEERERKLTEREAAVAAADKQLGERVSELVAIQARLEALEKERNDHNESNWAGLVKLYETMKPRDAAVIFNSLDKPVLLEILDRMKPAKASPILGLMEPESARQVTADLAAKRSHSTTLTN